MKFGGSKNPLFVSVRSGSKFSMPGMMDTVLNIGMNETTMKALAEKSGNERFVLDTYRRLITMFGSTVMGIERSLFEKALDALKDGEGRQGRHRPHHRGPAGAGEDLQGDLREGDGEGVPQRPAPAAEARHQRRVRLLVLRPGGQVPEPEQDRAQPRHGVQRPGDGLREHGRELGNRRRLHAEPVHRREGSSSPSTSPTRRARTSWRGSGRRSTSTS